MSMLTLLTGGTARGATSVTDFAGTTDAEGFGAAMQQAVDLLDAGVAAETTESVAPESQEEQNAPAETATDASAPVSGAALLGSTGLALAVSSGTAASAGLASVPANGETPETPVVNGAQPAHGIVVAAAPASTDAAATSGAVTGAFDLVEGAAGVDADVASARDASAAAAGTDASAVQTATVPGSRGTESLISAAAATGAPASAAASAASVAAPVVSSAEAAQVAVEGADSSNLRSLAGAGTGTGTGTGAGAGEGTGTGAGAGAGARDADARQPAHPAQPVAQRAASVHAAPAASVSSVSGAPVSAASASPPAAAAVPSAAETAQVAPEVADFDNVRSLTRVDGAGVSVVTGAATSVGQTTPATAPAPTPVPQDFSAQLARPIANIRSAGAGEHVITINVTPENLGPVTVRAHVGADGMRIELVAPTEAGREALKAILADLRRDLAGLGVATPSLSAGGQAGQQQAGGNATLSLAGDQAQGQGQGGNADAARDERTPRGATPGRAGTPLNDETHDRDIRGLATGIDVLA